MAQLQDSQVLSAYAVGHHEPLDVYKAQIVRQAFAQALVYI